MVEGYREPSIEYENGICFIQDGTYTTIPKEEVCNKIIKPALNVFKISDEPYRIIKLGCPIDEINSLITEMKTMIQQISKMTAKMKKVGSKIAIPDAKFITNKINKLNNDLENEPYKIAKVLEKERAKTICEEVRICLRNCITFNYETALKLNEQGHEINIPQEFIADMELIRLKVTADQEKNQKKNKSILNRIFNRKE